MAAFHSARGAMMHVNKRFWWGKKYKVSKRMIELKCNSLFSVSQQILPNIKK